MSGGTFHEEVYDLLANDAHATVLISAGGLRPDGRTWSGRQVHVWHLPDGKGDGVPAARR
ncbi:MAG TPA: hypothetical protein VFW71_13955 [Actinomycetota bacterium]|nr:hypothetical protein [Actinomycetota bacterium]